MFSLLKSLLENREQTEKNASFRRSNSPTISDSEALPTNAFDRESLNKKQDKDKVATLEEWIKDQSNEPMVQQYFDAYVERFVTESHFNQTKCSDVELTAFLRHRMAVCEKSKYSIHKFIAITFCFWCGDRVYRCKSKSIWIVGRRREDSNDQKARIYSKNGSRGVHQVRWPRG